MQQDEGRAIDAPAVEEDMEVKLADLKRCEHCERLRMELDKKETRWIKETEHMKHQHEEETRQLKQELFVLQAKVTSDHANDSNKSHK